MIKTNLDNATQKEKEKFFQLLNEAHKILYASVVQRGYRDVSRQQPKLVNKP